MSRFEDKSKSSRSTTQLRNIKEPGMLKIVRSSKAVCAISEFARGDIFLREGSPCMLLEHKLQVNMPDVEANKLVLIANLGTGRAWFVHQDENVRRINSAELHIEVAE